MEKIVEAPTVGRGFWDFASEWPLLTATLGLFTLWSVERMWKAWCAARNPIRIETRLDRVMRRLNDEAEAEAYRDDSELQEE